MTQWGLDVLFNPAKRHMDEEKRRLQSTREEIGDSSGGKRIDFDSGKVVIERRADDDADADAGDTPDPHASEAVTGDETDDASTKINGKINKKNGKSTPTAAAKTAAERGAERHRRARAQRGSGGQTRN